MHVSWNTVQHGLVSHPFENKDTIFQVEVVVDLAYGFFSCDSISINQILTKYGRLIQWHRDFLGVVSNNCSLPSPKTIRAYSRSLKEPSIIKTQQNVVPWCSDTGIIFSGNFKRMSVVINRNIWNKHFFLVWFGYRFSFDDVRGFIL